VPELPKAEIIALPEPQHEGPVSVEQAILYRRSHREYTSQPLTLHEISQLLWAAQGITSSRGLRAAPSAGALYPLEIYLIAGGVDTLAQGIYKYQYNDHTLLKCGSSDRRNDLSHASLKQGSITKAPAVLLFCAVNERVTRKYGERGLRYIFMEIGHAAQNVCLQATALGLGTVVIGAFRDEAVKYVVSPAQEEQPLYILPVGRL
jgi:SagB-type dehydrogenase family enzyme